MPNIAVEILRPDQPRRGKRMQLYFVFAGLTALVTAAITYAVIVQFGLGSKLSLPAPVNPPAASQQVVSTPLSDEPVPDVRDKISPVVPKNQSRAGGKKIATTGSPPSASVVAKPPGQRVAAAPLSVEPVPDIRNEVSRTPPEIQGRAKSKKPVTSGSPPSASMAAKPSGQQVVAAPLSVEPVPDVRDEISQVPSKIQGRAESEKPATTDSPPSVVAKPLGQQIIPAPLSGEPVPDVRDQISQVPSKIQGQTKSKKTAAFPPPASSATPPSLTLTGILWHEDPSERRAVINGTVLTEGSEIEGVKVVEIYPTYVRFSQNGRAFEISMNYLER